MVDYTAAIATAQRLITENGRSVTFIKLDDTVDVGAMPWKGTADPRATPDSELTLDAVFVDPHSLTALGENAISEDLLKRSEKIMMVSPGGAVDLTSFEEVIDGGQRWRINGVETLQPGSLIVLNFVGVRR